MTCRMIPSGSAPRRPWAGVLKTSAKAAGSLYLDGPIRDAASDFAAARSHRWARAHRAARSATDCPDHRPPTLEGLKPLRFERGRSSSDVSTQPTPTATRLSSALSGPPPGAVERETLSYTPPVALLARFDVRATATDDGTPAAVTEGILSSAIGPPNSSQLRLKERLVVPVQMTMSTGPKPRPHGDRVHFTATGLPDGLSIFK